MAVAALGIVFGAANAHAQQPNNPLAGLPAEVHQIALAVDSGDAARIVDHLRSETVVYVTYPGHGEERPRSEAEELVPQFVVSGGSEPDAMGPAEYRLIAVWLPDAMDPDVALVGSGIGADGERETTIFGLEEIDGEWRIGSYGIVGGYQGMPEGVESTMAFLDWLATQGEYREVTAPLPSAPAPPATGTGVEVDSGGGAAGLWLGVLVSGLAMVGAVLLIPLRRRA